MLDINLGNKTLIVGVGIALILAYGMINFNAGNAATPSFQSVEAATYESSSPAAAPVGAPAEVNTQVAGPVAEIDQDSLSKVQRAAAADIVDDGSTVRRSRYPKKWQDD